MPGYEITGTDGKKYRVEGPEGYTQEQAYKDLQGKLASEGTSAGPTIGGDIARGLGHGLLSGMGMGQGAPEGSSTTRQISEGVGETVPGFVAGMIPGGAMFKAGVGGVTGAMQPAKDWTERAKNTAVGAGSGLVGQGIGKYIAAHSGELNKLANEAIGSALGFQKLGSWGGLGGVWLGRNVGHSLQSLTGGRGLADLVAAIARNPGLAAQLGIKASPYLDEGAGAIRDYLGKPSQ